MSIHLPVQFVWVPTTLQDLPISVSDAERISQINYNLNRANAAFGGTLTPKNGSGYSVSTATNKDFITKDTLNSSYSIPVLKGPQSDDSYLQKSLIKLTAPLHKTNLLGSDASIPNSYTNLQDLKRLYTQIHPEAVDYLKDIPTGDTTTYRDFQTKKGLNNGAIIVFITHLTDSTGLPIPQLIDWVSTPSSPSKCVAISYWTLGDQTHPNTWNDSIANRFNSVPWCNNMRRGGALVFALGAVCGLNPEFNSNCINGANQRYPNINVLAYNDGKSNVRVNSNQLLYMGNPIGITCPGEVDQPNNIMDMSSDDARYYLSPAQKDIVNVMFPPKNPNKPEDPEDPLVPSVDAPAPTYDMGMFFLSLLVLWLVLSLWIGQLLSWGIAKYPELYYKTVNPFGHVSKETDNVGRRVIDWYENLFLSPLKLAPGTTTPGDQSQVNEIINNQRLTLPQKKRELHQLGIAQITVGQGKIPVYELEEQHIQELAKQAPASKPVEPSTIHTLNTMPSSSDNKSNLEAPKQNNIHPKAEKYPDSEIQPHLEEPDSDSDKD